VDSLYFYELGAHRKFQKPRTSSSGRKVTGDREKRRIEREKKYG
jgi:hypothetical protein